MRTSLLLLANNVDLNGTARRLSFRLGLRLLHDTLRNDLLLDDLPERGGHVVEKDGGGHAPAEEEHHDRHDGAHRHRLAALRLRLGAHVNHHRDERENAEEHVEEDVGGSGDPAARLDDLGHGERDGRQDTKEARGQQ